MNDSPPSSTAEISARMLFYRGFLEGLRRAASAPDSRHAAVAYDLAEAKIQVAELNCKVKDLTDTLAELQDAFRLEISTPAQGDAATLPLSHSSSNKSYAAIVSPLSSTASRNTFSRVRSPPYTEAVKSIVPEYYSESLNNENQSGVERALRSLFQKAQTGDEFSLSLVKALCREAHATVPERKSFGQKFVLARWRNPQSLSFPQDSSVTPNPQHSDPPEVWVEYYTRYPSSLPKGVRRDLATGGPLYSDIVASRILAHVRPAISQTRVEFNAAMVSLFSNPGEYRRMIMEHHIHVPSKRDYHPFREEMKSRPNEPVTSLDVARHYAKCGIEIEEVERSIEGWALEYAKER
ncbi:hypothetical protein GYMLUDRAFT_44310, partial [Collybiopsis luxurians FD-317 M1]